MTTRAESENKLRLLQERDTRYKYNRLAYIFPDQDIVNFPYIPTGIVHSRDKYPKQLDFFKASSTANQLVLIAPNRSGKSMAGGYADTVHITGLYPKWWEGKKFKKPIKAWICGAGTKTVRDGIQTILLGSTSDIGSGLLPKDCIVNVRVKPGTPGAIEMMLVKHFTNGVEDGVSEVSFKSYEEEVSAFSSAAIDLIHEDEEPPLLIDTECTARIFSTRGLKYITFTPDKGLSDTMLQFFPDGNVVNGHVGTGKYAVSFDMDDVPHFTDEEKKAFFDALPPYQREAKFYGRPSVGSGLVYPIYETDIQFKAKQGLPEIDWYRAYAMDPGWARTSVVWGAYNELNDTWYIYDCYSRGQENAEIHASAIRSRGDWMCGLIDKAANRNDSLTSKEITLDTYTNLGLNLSLSRAGKEVEAGIVEVWNRLSTGRLKIAEHLYEIFKELRLYRRDDKGQIVTNRGRDGTGHDLLDCVRYLVRQGEEVMMINPKYKNQGREFSNLSYNRTTGY
jgi:phage terminase large subunit-like protein